jgi:predicted transcriptional regulator
MVPVFMLRSSVRELLGAGYVKEVGEAYQVTEKGREKAE